MIAQYKERVKNLFKKKPKYETLYKEENKMVQHWEFKYNKLHRQLSAILKEADQ